MAVGDRRSGGALAPRVEPRAADAADAGVEAAPAPPAPDPEPVVSPFPRAVRLLVLICAALASWGLVLLLARLALGGR